jgi:hypothetical protein
VNKKNKWTDNNGNFNFEKWFKELNDELQIPEGTTEDELVDAVWIMREALGRIASIAINGENK